MFNYLPRIQEYVDIRVNILIGSDGSIRTSMQSFHYTKRCTVGKGSLDSFKNCSLTGSLGNQWTLMGSPKNLSVNGS